MSIIKHVTLQKIVAHNFRYDPRNLLLSSKFVSLRNILILNIYSLFQMVPFEMFIFIQKSVAVSRPQQSCVTTLRCIHDFTMPSSQ